jgi:tellurite resistance protein
MIGRLRDRLRARGQRIAVTLRDVSNLSPDAAELLAASVEYGPLCEAMYLMMSADGKITQDEREVLKGAIRTLSDDAVLSVHIEAMLDAAARNVAEHGREGRLREVASQIQADSARAEVAFILAAAIAFADGAIADEENETLSRLAEGLGIDEARVDELLDSVEADLARRL